MNLDDFDPVDELPAPPRKEIPAADRELLELAARALGAQFEEVDGEGYGNLHFEDGSAVLAWNPLQFSGDAFELAAKLKMELSFSAAHVWVLGQGITEMHGADGDQYASGRRAITRAAAEIGKQHA